jgi:hypothetical protein
MNPKTPSSFRKERRLKTLEAPGCPTKEWRQEE